MAGSAQGLNQIAIVFLACMAFLLLVLPRRYVLLPMFAGACYMTVEQGIQVAGLNFGIIRILTLVGWLRLTIRGEWRIRPLTMMDRAILYWMLASILIYTLLWGTTEAFIYKSGNAYDALGLYFLFRSIVRDVDEIAAAFRLLVFVTIPLAGFMLVERFTGRNMFAVFGGVPDFTLVREGTLRCQGPFPHSILAGTFAAALIPQFISLWWQRGLGKMLALIGVSCALIITATSGSSGPIMTFASGLVGLAFWPWRRQMRAVRWGIVFSILALQLVMKAPFWFLIAHLAVRSGSDAFYRAFLIDRTIAHFDEWWLIGTKYLVPWATKLTDITNFYVRNAMDGGLVTLILLLTVLKRGFAGVGLAIRAQRHASLWQQRCIWALGASLFAHVMTFLAVWYWDQNIVSWYLLLAMLGTVSGRVYLSKKEEPATEPRATSTAVWSSEDACWPEGSLQEHAPRFTL